MPTVHLLCPAAIPVFGLLLVNPLEYRCHPFGWVVFVTQCHHSAGSSGVAALHKDCLLLEVREHLDADFDVMRARTRRMAEPLLSELAERNNELQAPRATLLYIQFSSHGDAADGSMYVQQQRASQQLPGEGEVNAYLRHRSVR